MKKRLKRIFTCILCLAVLYITSLTAFAAESGSVTILFEHENEAISGAVFHLYQVAEIDGNGAYQLTDTFAKYPVSVDDLTGDKKVEAASILAAYVSHDETIVADVEVKTNSHGAVKTEGLPEGIYLLIGKSVDRENVRYIPFPSLIYLPSADVDGTPLYNFTVMPKYEKRELTEETLERQVVKLWKDEGYVSHRPQEVTVWLLRNSEFYDEQVLNAENNWRYTWSDLNATDSWTLLEVDVPEGYTVTVEQQDVTFLLTNTFDDPNIPPDDPDDSDTTDNPDDPDNPDTTNNQDNQDNPNDPENPDNPENSDNPGNPPQTGDNSHIEWWIVLLVSSVIGLVGIGFLSNKKRKAFSSEGEEIRK